MTRRARFLRSPAGLPSREYLSRLEGRAFHFVAASGPAVSELGGRPRGGHGTRIPSHSNARDILRARGVLLEMWVDVEPMSPGISKPPDRPRREKDQIDFQY